MGCPCMFELGSGLSILLHGSLCLFVCLDCAVSLPSASSSMLKSESVIRTALVVFLRIPWPIQGLLLLARNFRILSSISLANMAAILTGIAWNPEIPFSAMGVSRVLILQIPRSRNILLFPCVFSNFSPQTLAGFRLTKLSPVLLRFFTEIFFFVLVSCVFRLFV